MYLPYKKVKSQNRRNKGHYDRVEEITKKLTEDYGTDINISRDSIRESAEIEAQKYRQSRMSPEKIINRAIFIDTVNKAAKKSGIEEWIPKEVFGDRFDNYVYIPNLGKMDTKALNKMMAYAKRKDTRANKIGKIEEMLSVNPVFPTITITGIVTGLFFLLPNLTGTGNIIAGSIGNFSVSALLGASLLVMGLIGAFFWINKRYRI